MKFTVVTRSQVEVTALLAEMEVRYWEDAKVNDLEEDDDNPKIPFVNKNIWTIKINLETGQILNWPVGTTAKTHYKVCDAGSYSLLDSEDNVVAQKYCYVPSMLGPNGYGDYVILDIDKNGYIKDWFTNLDYFNEE